MKKFWIAFVTVIGSFCAGLVAVFLYSSFVKKACEDIDSTVSDKVKENTKLYNRMVARKAEEIADMKVEEVVAAFQKAFGGKK